MKALVTGGGGFLGTAIIQQLLGEGHQVKSYSRGSYPHLEAWGVNHHQGNLSQLPSLLKAMDGCDAVFHVGAKAGIWGAYQDFYEANVKGTEHVIRACQHLGITQLIYTSTPSVVYRPGGIAGGDESLPYPTSFDAPYPATKALAEQFILQANSPHLQTVALRPHLIWGPGDHHFLPRLIQRAKAGKLRFLGQTPQLVDCVYIDNAASAHLLAWKNLDRCAGKAYFITQGQPMAIQDLINGILKAVDVAPVKKSISPRLALGIGWFLEQLYGVLPLKGEPPMTRFLAHQLSTPHWFNIQAARRDLGYEPLVSIEEGFKHLEEWWNHAAYPSSSPEFGVT